MNSGFPRLQRRSELKPRRMFDFEYDTSIININGIHLRVLVVVRGDDEFEIWNLDRAIPMCINDLCRKDQLAIHKFIDERLQQSEGEGKYPVLDISETRATIRELNEVRGIK